MRHLLPFFSGTKGILICFSNIWSAMMKHSHVIIIPLYRFEEKKDWITKDFVVVVLLTRINSTFALLDLLLWA